MKALMFELSGKTAFFGKPDVNSYARFTYNHIHKIALLGLLGASIGLQGYNQQYWKRRIVHQDIMFPEFYEILKELKIAIVPLIESGVFSKRIHIFNNSTGHASREISGTLIVREQWLENPRWRIYLLDDNSIDKKIYDKIKENLIASRYKYLPYLGKNNHFADIKNCDIIELKFPLQKKHIHSLFPANSCQFDLHINKTHSDKKSYIYHEFLPVKLRKEDNAYEFDEFTYTNLKIETVCTSALIYNHMDCNMVFF